jgi:hypothetical protein
VGVSGTLAFKITLHNMARRIGMGAGVHNHGDFLAENAGFRLTMHGVDNRLIKIWPERDVCTKRMAEINEYFLSHKISPLYL